MDYEEFEEVESPFAAKSKAKTTRRESLRTRKNVFNRPFATGSSVAPAVFEKPAGRRTVGHQDMNDVIHHRQGELSGAEIDYLDHDEEEEIEEEIDKRPVRVTPRKTKPKRNVLSKLAWSAIGLLILRLICMDRGVWDYFSTEAAINEKVNELSAVRVENKSLVTEISRIQTEKGFQRQLAKEHLGVIAADEFLILFAGETDEPVSETQL